MQNFWETASISYLNDPAFQIDWESDQIDISNLGLAVSNKLDMVKIIGKDNEFPVSEGKRIYLKTNSFWKKMPVKRYPIPKNHKSFYFGRTETGEDIYFIIKKKRGAPEILMDDNVEDDFGQVETHALDVAGYEKFLISEEEEEEEEAIIESNKKSVSKDIAIKVYKGILKCICTDPELSSSTGVWNTRNANTCLRNFLKLGTESIYCSQFFLNNLMTSISNELGNVSIRFLAIQYGQNLVINVAGFAKVFDFYDLKKTDRVSFAIARDVSVVDENITLLLKRTVLQKVAYRRQDDNDNYEEGKYHITIPF